MNLPAPPFHAKVGGGGPGGCESAAEARKIDASADAKQTLVPSAVSLAQRLLPTGIERLVQHDNMKMDLQYEDEFEGVCSPLGSPTMAPKKTTGLDESDCRDYGHSHDLEKDHAEAGDAMAKQEEMAEYLPQSAALLMSALQGSAQMIDGYEGKGLISFDSLPNLVDDVSAAPKDETPSRSNDAAGFAGSPPLRRLQSMEKEADALLDAIRRDTIGTGSPQQSILRLRRSPSAVISGGSEDLITSVRSDDDEGSIGGDMARLSISIAHLQRDLANADFSQIDHIHDGEFSGLGGDMGGHDGENGTLARLKLWFSRGMIMEQKLLHSYVTPSDGASNGGTATQSSGRYVDNPVLIWSLALMWAFVVIILMNPKIAELVEGGDPGQLANIIEWLFG